MASPPPPPAFRLADGIGVARFDDSVIVLDVSCDRYRKVGGEAAAALLAIADARPIDPNHAGLAALHRAGFIADRLHSDAPYLNPRSMPPPTSSVLEGGAPYRVATRHDLGVVLDCAASRLDLRRWPLERVLRALRNARQRHSTQEIGELARDFDMGRRLAPFRPCCLPDALAFTRRARRHGHDVRLVFGVKCHPFEAHCWAQIGEVVLTDPLERVLRFQPILTL
ncbi:lasso peptide biosynthesis B2 protein [Novosphingobium olei]|uniref:Lasso peptide biosynthesis B2 protein n=1 Tax=Novosphingobium olei TaxID=2728851 RepID=A0A7Y0GCT1_9SPHN|nr:lasso peptide biosynthesis B2 protein [Novosphingobium olei]NML95932.1 lasso peptide biosynthesis B2 protein [Novosphingobium olei]